MHVGHVSWQIASPTASPSVKGYPVNSWLNKKDPDIVFCGNKPSFDKSSCWFVVQKKLYLSIGSNGATASIKDPFAPAVYWLKTKLHF